MSLSIDLPTTGQHRRRHNGSAAQQRRIANAILKDREQRRAAAKPQADCCFTCGRAFLRGDGRFCSAICRERFDAGFPPAEANAGLHPELMPHLHGLFGWRVVAGSPGVQAGSLHYGDLVAHCERRRRKATKTQTTDLIRPARQCLCCGGDLPRFHGTGRARRRARSDAKYCSEKCKKIGPCRGVIRPEATIPQNPNFAPSVPHRNMAGGSEVPESATEEAA